MTKIEELRQELRSLNNKKRRKLVALKSLIECRLTLAASESHEAFKKEDEARCKEMEEKQERYFEEIHTITLHMLLKVEAITEQKISDEAKDVVLLN